MFRWSGFGCGFYSILSLYIGYNYNSYGYRPSQLKTETTLGFKDTQMVDLETLAIQFLTIKASLAILFLKIFFKEKIVYFLGK